MSLKSLMHIGPESAETGKQLPEVTKALVAVLNTSAADSVKEEAIRAIGGMFKVENVSVSSCHLSNLDSNG